MILEYFESELCPPMLFDSKEDAAYFDTLLEDYCSNPEAREEFKKALNQYASYSAVEYAIEANDFHFNLEGPYSDRLILACENMVAGSEGLEDDDCYTCAMNYILNHYTKNL